MDSEARGGNYLLGAEAIRKGGAGEDVAVRGEGARGTPLPGPGPGPGPDALKVKSVDEGPGAGPGPGGPDLSQRGGAAGTASSFNTWMSDIGDGAAGGGDQAESLTQVPGYSGTAGPASAHAQNAAQANHPQWARQSADAHPTADWYHENLSDVYSLDDSPWWWGGELNTSGLNATLAPPNATTLEPMPYPYLSGYSLPHVIVTSIFVTLLMIVIVFGNALVIIAIARDRHLKAVQNWFIASLAVSDLFVGENTHTHAHTRCTRTHKPDPVPTYPYNWVIHTRTRTHAHTHVALARTMLPLVLRTHTHTHTLARACTRICAFSTRLDALRQLITHCV